MGKYDGKEEFIGKDDDKYKGELKKIKLKEKIYINEKMVLNIKEVLLKVNSKDLYKGYFKNDLYEGKGE